MRLEHWPAIGAPCSPMLDILFWVCAIVALTGSAALIGIALFTGRPSGARSARVAVPREDALVMRHFGRA